MPRNDITQLLTKYSIIQGSLSERKWEHHPWENRSLMNWDFLPKPIDCMVYNIIKLSNVQMNMAWTLSQVYCTQLDYDM